MLSDKRIDEAKNNVRSYLQESLLEKKDFKSLVFETYMRNHRESLDVAKELHKQGLSNLWVIIASYYSMFYIANAVLYKLGYKVGHKIAHKVTADALIVLVRDKLKDNILENFEFAADEALAISDNQIQNFDFERVKRGRLQYETTDEIKLTKAETSLERAKEFSMEMEKVLED